MTSGMLLCLSFILLPPGVMPVSASAVEINVLDFLGAINSGEISNYVAIVSLCIFQTVLVFLLFNSRRKRLQTEEERRALAAIIESSNDAILSETLDGTITSWNAGAEKLYGYLASEVLGRKVSALAATDQLMAESLERVREGNADCLESVRVTRDGRQIDVSISISPIKDEHGTVTGASTIARDITARNRSEQKLRESELRFRMMADTAPVMIWVSGPDNLCTFFNRRWLEFTGRTLEQELGMGWSECIHSEDRLRCLEVHRTACVARQAFTQEYRLKRADGHYRWIADTGVPELMPNGDLAGYIGTCTDITERKQDELVRQHLTSRLLTMQDEERRRVAAELHDGLGQSLSIIRNRAMISLRDNIPEGVVREQLREISATAAEAMVEVRQIAHNLRPFELDRLGLVAAIEAMIQRVSESTSIVLSANLEQIDGMLSPEAETSVYRIVQESLNNVIKHSRATAARIEIRKNGNLVAVSMMDNGIGIPVSSPGNHGRKSGGVGLAGIAERVRALGGSFQIDSQPDEGTRLTVHLESPAAQQKHLQHRSARSVSSY